MVVGLGLKHQLGQRAELDFILCKPARHRVSSGSVFLLSPKGKFFFSSLHSHGMLNTSVISA